MNLSKICAVIIDDEPMARELLETYCKKTGKIIIAASCKSSTEAFEALHEHAIDVMFLDINMPGISGLNFLRSLKAPPKVVFTTAYHEYAVEAFELEAIDYLLKPVTYERFLKAVQRISNKELIPVQNIIKDNYTVPSSIFLKVNRRLVQVELNDILYIESLGDYVKVFTVSAVIVSFNTIGKLLHILPESLFQRIHRSYMVALKKISFMEGNFVRILDHDIPIGPTYKENLMKKLNLTDEK